MIGNHKRSFRRFGFIAFAIVMMMVHAALPILAQNGQQVPTAEFFNSLTPQQIAGYFSQMKPEQLQGFFTQMDQGALMNVIGKLGDEGVKAVVAQLPPEVTQGFIDNMTPETYFGFVAGIKDPELLASLGFDDAETRDAYLLENLDAIDPALAETLYGQLLLATDGKDLESAILSASGVDDQTAFFLGLNDEDQAALLSMLDADELNQLSSELQDLTEFLAGLDPQSIGDALDKLNVDEAANYLAGVDPADLGSVLGAMDSLGQLQGLLEAYAADLEELGIDTAALDDKIAELEEAQTALAEEYGMSYEEMDTAGAEVMDETGDETSGDVDSEGSGDSGETGSDDSGESGSDDSGESGSDNSGESGSDS